MRRAWPVLVLGLVGCEEEEMCLVEALDALAQVNESGRGVQATSEAVEISTGFTIGAALAEAAETIGEFWDSQAPCTTVTPGILASAWYSAARTSGGITVCSMPSINMNARSWTVSPTGMGAQSGSSTSW